MPSSDLTLVFEHINEPENSSHPVFLLCVFRDENVLLEHFISYYQSIGVTHFIMVDNLSEDEGVEYLKQLNDINMTVYQAKGSYRDAAFGTKWINDLLEKHCIDQYCFSVDVDELFYFDRKNFESLQQLISDMESKKRNVVPVTLLDMYPEKTNDDYQKGDDFLTHSPFFDHYNTAYYNNVFTIYKNFSHKTGGVRERVFDKIVCIHKFPFFKYNFKPLGLAPGYHFFQLAGEVLKDSDKIHLYEKPSVLLHFKFIKPNLKEFFEKRVMLNEDWDDSTEYKSYASVITDNSSIQLFDKNYSSKFENNSSLKAFFDPAEKPKISVIIPIYNVEKYIDKCLHSVRNQTLQDIEILCVDDCSPDKSRQIVEKHAAQDPRITLISHEKNLGLGGARNSAIRVAKADFIASVDSDDYMLPEMLKRLWIAAEEGEFDVVCCGFNRVDAEGNILSYETYSAKTITNQDHSINIFSTTNPAFWNKLWRKSLFTENEIFFPVGDYFEDMPTTPRLLSKAKKIRIINDRLYHYFVRPKSISNTFGPKHLIDYFKGFEIILEFLESNDLIERYQDEFVDYVNSSIRFHSETVISSGMDKGELEQYFRQFLTLKIAFFENRDLFKFKNLGELLELLKQRRVPGFYQIKNTELLSNISKYRGALSTLKSENAKAVSTLESENSKAVSTLELENAKALSALELENAEALSTLQLENAEVLGTLELENAKALEEGLNYQNKVVAKEQENTELLEKFSAYKKLLAVSKQENTELLEGVSNYKDLLGISGEEKSGLLEEVLKYKNLFDISRQENVNVLSEVSTYKNKLQVIEQENVNVCSEVSRYKNTLQEIEQENVNLRSEVAKCENQLKVIEQQNENVRSEVSNYKETLQELERDKAEALSCAQKSGVFLFGFLFRPFITKRQYLKLKRNPWLFFNDSKNRFTRMIGTKLKII